MQRDRADRYQSAAEMKQAILACLPDQAPVVRPSPEVDTIHEAVQERPPIEVVPERVTLPAATAPDERQRRAGSGPRPVVQTPPTELPRRRVQRRVHKVKLCPRCRHRNELTARFCVRCGRAFGGVPPAVLRVIEPVRAAWEMPVRKSPLLLGRSQPSRGHRPDFDMTFYDPEGYVSRRHAHIIKARNGYFVADLGSSNGTLVNGRRLPAQRPQLLRNGDEITIGEVVLQFLLR
jgi:hypothetical protein